jgi:predicted amidohydrolase
MSTSEPRTPNQMTPPDRLRIASLQYLIRPVRSFEEFRDQVDGLLMTAADYKCQMAVLPEYFTLQLLTLGNVKRPIDEQVRDLAKQVPRFVETMATLAQASGLYVVGGTIPTIEDGTDDVRNVSFIFTPDGQYRSQGKLHMTRFETEEWGVRASSRLKIFETPYGRLAICICYDVEFPEIARAAARNGAHILIVPSCTDDRQGMLRVRYCAQARAIENQMFVVVAHTVGSLPMVPAVSLNYGQASILTPSDFPFSRDGVLAEGIPNQETMIIGELNLRTIQETRTSGTVLPLLDSERTAALVELAEVVPL